VGDVYWRQPVVMSEVLVTEFLLKNAVQLAGTRTKEADGKWRGTGMGV
jgi:hypothetical protein